MAINRYGFSLVELRDGRVMAIGGASSAGDAVFNRSAEVFDPANGHWSRLHDMNEGWGFAPAVALEDGRVLVAGGSIHEGSLLGSAQSDSAEVYDPGTGRWEAAGSMATKRRGGRLALLGDGRVLVAGGTRSEVVGSGVNLSVVEREAIDSSEIWDPASGNEHMD